MCLTLPTPQPPHPENQQTNTRGFIQSNEKAKRIAHSPISVAVGEEPFQTIREKTHPLSLHIHAFTRLKKNKSHFHAMQHVLLHWLGKGMFLVLLQSFLLIL